MVGSKITESPIKIVIIRSSSIGDVVLSTSCLTLLRGLNFPCEVSWVGKGTALKLINTSFPGINCLDLDKHSLVSLLKELAAADLVVDLQTNLRSNMLTLFLAIFYRLPVYRARKGGLGRARLVAEAYLRRRFAAVPHNHLANGSHQFHIMADALRKALRKELPSADSDFIDRVHTPYIEQSRRDRDQIRERFSGLQSGVWLALAAGAAHAAKRAPLSVLCKILGRLIERLKPHGQVNLLLLGGKEDIAVVSQLLTMISWRGEVLNVTGQLSLWESSLVLSQASILLTNDSSLLHIGEAVGVPCAAMFGPTIEGFGFPPWHPQSKAFSVEMGCRPCSKHGKRPCRYQDQLCFERLPMDQIVEHLYQVLLKDR